MLGQEKEIEHPDGVLEVSDSAELLVQPQLNWSLTGVSCIAGRFLAN